MFTLIYQIVKKGHLLGILILVYKIKLSKAKVLLRYVKNDFFNTTSVLYISRSSYY